MVPDWGFKIPPASWPKNRNIKQKQYCDEFNKDFKNGPYQKKNLKKRWFIRSYHCPMRLCFLYIMVSEQLQFESLETDPHSVMTTEEKLPKGPNTQAKAWPLKGVLALTPSPIQAPTRGPSTAPRLPSPHTVAPPSPCVSNCPSCQIPT